MADVNARVADVMREDAQSAHDRADVQVTRTREAYQAATIPGSDSA